MYKIRGEILKQWKCAQSFATSRDAWTHHVLLSGVQASTTENSENLQIFENRYISAVHTITHALEPACRPQLVSVESSPMTYDWWPHKLSGHMMPHAATPWLITRHTLLCHNWYCWWIRFSPLLRGLESSVVNSCTILNSVNWVFSA